MATTDIARRRFAILMIAIVLFIVSAFLFAFETQAADDPPTPVVIMIYPVGSTHTLTTLQIGEGAGKSLCFNITSNTGEATPAGMCYLQAREILFSQVVHIDEQNIAMSATIDLGGRLDRHCFISVGESPKASALFICIEM